MNNITANYGKSYLPTQGLLVYRQASNSHHGHVQAFDVDPVSGHPINFHPLTEQESRQLAKILTVEKEKKKGFLRLNGLLPENVLYLDVDQGRVMWYTPPQQRNLYFIESLTIPNGMAPLPALVWLASKNYLFLFALLSAEKPTIDTPLYYAPFFNTNKQGGVCMGTVSVGIRQSSTLNEFMAAWEESFFNSYFSHLFDEHQPVQGNIIQLWQRLIDQHTDFPLDELVTSPFTLKQLTGYTDGNN
jgi:PRTRC genetic system protein B